MDAVTSSFVAEHAEAGADCPTCGQLVKAYRRALTAAGARTLIALHRYAGGQYASIPDLARLRLRDVAHQGGYLTLGHYWGLIEEESRVRGDGGRAGWWRLTEFGHNFVTGADSISRYAHVYDGVVQMFSGELVGIRQSLGASFNYDELMGR